MTIESDEEYAETCQQAVRALSELAEYTDDGTQGLNNWEASWMWLVILSFQKLAGGEPDDDGSGGYKVTDTLY